MTSMRVKLSDLDALAESVLLYATHVIDVIATANALYQY